ncbi:MAG TPA: DUF6516 family protein [Acetobacteraceae bacterium]|nr:DUF6516 family protein [Acetobacteraceae bacterium]
MPRARPIRHRKRRYDDGMILEMVLWELPSPMRGSKHRLKYAWFYRNENARLAGCDHAAGKGDHRHHGAWQEPYHVTAANQWFADFLADVRAIRSRG